MNISQWILIIFMFTILSIIVVHNYFPLWFYNIDDLHYVVQDLYLTTGDPNIYNVMSNINSLLSVYCNVTYDRIKNEYTYIYIYIYIYEYIHKIIIITQCILPL